MRDHILRIVWAWLGYSRGLPLDKADLAAILERHGASVQAAVNQTLTNQLAPQLNSIREMHNDKTNQRLSIATQILSGLCAASAPDPKRAVELADQLMQALR